MDGKQKCILQWTSERTNERTHKSNAQKDNRFGNPTTNWPIESSSFIVFRSQRFDWIKLIKQNYRAHGHNLSIYIDNKFCISRFHRVLLLFFRRRQRHRRCAKRIIFFFFSFECVFSLLLTFCLSLSFVFFWCPCQIA